MFRQTLALSIRALRIDERLVRTHVVRLCFAGFIFFNLAIAHSEGVVFGAPGLRFFSQMTYLNFIFISLAGITIFATAITEEKEEGTLGLLKLAGLSPVSILLGKSTSRLLSGVLLLLIQVPFALLAVTLGGVTTKQVIDAYCSLTAYVLLLANLGLFWSVVCKQHQQARSLMMLSLFGFFAGPWIVQFLLDDAVRAGTLRYSQFTVICRAACRGLIEASVLNRASVTMATGFDQSVFSAQFLSNLGGALIFFLISWALFEFSPSDADVTTSPARGFVLRRTGGFRFLGSGRAWSDAIAWKEFHFIAGGWTYMLLKFVVYGAVAAGFAMYVHDALPGQFRATLGTRMMASAVLVAMVESGLYAARIFEEEIKQKTLAALIVLPISTFRIALSKVTGCLLGLIPACLFLLLGCVIDPSGFSNVLATLADWRWWFGVSYFLIFLHVIALLSVLLRWGALPLTLSIMILPAWCCGFALSGPAPGPSAEAAVVLFIIFFHMLCAIAILMELILGFLESAAAE